MKEIKIEIADKEYKVLVAESEEEQTAETIPEGHGMEESYGEESEELQTA